MRVLTSLAFVCVSSLLSAAEPAQRPSCDRSALYILRGQYQAALKQLDAARPEGSSDAERETLRGVALLLSGDAKKAVASFDLALDMQPSLAAAQFNRGVAWLQSKELAKATIDFEAVAQGSAGAPLRAAAAYHMAVALDGLRRSSEAERWLDRALSLDPQLDAALLFRGFLLERRGDLQGAGKAYRDYLARHPESPIALLRFGISAQRAGFIDTARTYLQKVVAAAPDSLEAVEARKYLVMWD